MGIYGVIWGVPLIAAIVCFLGDPAVVLQPLVALFFEGFRLLALMEQGALNVGDNLDQKKNVHSYRFS